MTPEEKAAFLAGMRFGVEQTIAEHDDLLDVAIEALYVEHVKGAMTLAAEHDRRIRAVMARVRRLRIGNDGEREALALIALERAR